MRSPRLLAIAAAVALAACGPAATAEPSEAALTTPLPSNKAVLWTRTEVDPAPTRAVVEAIAGSIGVPAAGVTAAVLEFEHLAGNRATIWVFRAGDLQSAAAVQRWVKADKTCGSPPMSTDLGVPTTLLNHLVNGLCQPEYLVALDPLTTAWIVEDGRYDGTGPVPTALRYVGLNEIAYLISWLTRNLPDLPLAPAGPPGPT